MPPPGDRALPAAVPRRRALRDAKVSVRSVQRIEAGQPASADTLRALAFAFELADPDFFLKPCSVPTDEEPRAEKERLRRDYVFVIGGYRPADRTASMLYSSATTISGLAVRRQGKSGFVPHLRREVFKALKPHHVDECPFVDLPNSKSSRWGGGVTADEMREMQWVKPELVAQIRFVEWTAEGRLRHAAFLGLRSDKSAREVRREWPGLSGG